MIVEQTFECKERRSKNYGIYAEVTLRFSRKQKRESFEFFDEWTRSAYGLSKVIRELTEQALRENHVLPLDVTLLDFKFLDVNLTDEAVEKAVRGCVRAAVEQFPQEAFQISDVPRGSE